jgi:hypothetical protein
MECAGVSQYLSVWFKASDMSTICRKVRCPETITTAGVEHRISAV